MMKCNTDIFRLQSIPAAFMAAILAGCAQSPALQGADTSITDGASKEPPAIVATDAATTLCTEGSAPVFEGEVEDDFGLSIAVCLRHVDDLAPALVSIHYSGEGGTRTVSCAGEECKGVIAFNRYTRYRFTVLTLTWRDENGVQSLSECVDAQHPGGPAKVNITHSWQPQGSLVPSEAAPKYPVVSRSATLELLRLESHLPDGSDLR